MEIWHTKRVFEHSLYKTLAKIASLRALSPKMRVCISLCFFLVGTINGLHVQGMDDHQCPEDMGTTSKRSLISVEQNWKIFEHTSNSVTFTLYTQKNPNVGQKLRINDKKKLKKSNFDASKPTRFVTHGWQSDRHSRSCKLIRKAYLSRSDCNVIIVDWSKYSKSLWYLFSTYMVKHRVGENVARMIDFLYEEGNLHTKNTTLIGYSLGAHVMGIAGYKTKYKVSYVVGFLLADSGESISKKSGNHVQIMHTNGGFLGDLSTIGHVDFFPNGGKHQPGCASRKCSHRRAYELFASSIKTPLKGNQCTSFIKFKAGKCRARGKMARMGGLKLTDKSGTYYLRTNSKAPYRYRP